MDRTLSLLVKFAALDRLTAPLRTMSGGAKKASRELIGTKREVLALERAASKTGGFRDLQGKVAATHQELDVARRRVTALKAAMAAAEGPTGRLARSLDAARNKVGRLDDRLQGQTTRLGKLGAELREAGVDVGRLASEEDRLARAIGNANGRMSTQQAQLDRMNARRDRIDRADARGADLRSRGAGMMAAGAAVVAPMVLLANSSAEFRSGMADIAIAANLTARDTDRITANILKMGPSVGQMPEDLRMGLASLVGSGLDPRIGQRMLAPIGRAATAQKAQVLDLANASYALYNNLRVPIGRVGDALDSMTQAGKTGGVEIRDMARHFPSLTAAAAGLGQQGVPAVADLASALQVAKDGAGDADEAANNVLNLLNKINAKETAGNFRKMGIDLPAALKKAYREGKTPLEAIAELTKKATGGDMARLSHLFGDAQAQAALRALIAGMQKYRDLRREAASARGVNQRDFAKRTGQDPAAQAARSSAQMARLKQVVGDQLNPALLEARVRMGALAERFANWIERNPAAGRALVLIVGAIGTLLVALGSLAIGLGVILPIFARGWAILSKLGPVLRLFGGLFGWIARAVMIAAGVISGFVGLPVWLVAAIGLAIAAAGVLIYKNWDRIKTTFMNGIRFLVSLHVAAKNAGMNIVRGLIGGIGAMFGALKAKVMSLGKSAIGWFKGVLGIRSPSRVFAQLGGHMMGGLALGLDRGVERPLARVRAAGVGLTRAMAISAVGATPALAAQPGAAQSAQVIHHHYTYEIRLDGSGDMQVQAKRLMAEMERLRRVQRDSSYEDRD